MKVVFLLNNRGAVIEIKLYVYFPRSFHTKRALKTHKQNAHAQEIGQPGVAVSSLGLGPPTHECRDCGQAFQTSYLLRQHIVEHMPFRCGECDAPYMSRKSLRDHCKSKHGEYRMIERVWERERDGERERETETERERKRTGGDGFMLSLGHPTHECRDCGQAFHTSYLLR